VGDQDHRPDLIHPLWQKHRRDAVAFSVGSRVDAIVVAAVGVAVPVPDESLHRRERAECVEIDEALDAHEPLDGIAFTTRVEALLQNVQPEVATIQPDATMRRALCCDACGGEQFRC